MSVQWFPGHMAKTRRIIQENLKLVDVVIEICDARIPTASQNPLLKEVIGSKKPALIILNKEDLADPQRTNYWLKTLNAKENVRAISLNARISNQKTKEIINKELHVLTEAKRERFRKKNIPRMNIRAMIVGIPNVGKSTFINALVGKRATQIGDKPGVTRGKQWIRVSDDTELLDTPGILWPKFENEELGYRLAITGAISDEVFVWEEAAFRLVKHLKAFYPQSLIDRYKLTAEQVETLDPYELMLEIGKKRGALLSGGRVDEEKTSMLLLKDFRKGALGRVSLE